MPKKRIVDIRRYDAGHPVDARIVGERGGSAPRNGCDHVVDRPRRLTPLVR